MNGFKKAFDNFTSKFQPQEEPQACDVNMEFSEQPPGRIAWPPSLTSSPKILGEVKDQSGHTFKRDIGRSFQLGGHTYYIFGDTFCHEEGTGNFCGVTNNTISLVPSLDHPPESRYLTLDAKVPEFVPLSDEEEQYCKSHAERGENKRYVNWSFGGVIEKPGSDGTEGWLFYDTVEFHGAEPVKQCGTGVATVKVDPDTGHVECERVGPFPLFDPEDPLWGNMANIAAPDGWTYLLSGKGLDNFMARVPTDADFSNPENYQFLKKGGEWVSSYQGPHGPFGELAHDVVQGQGQGAIIYIPDHAPEGKPYMWFGCEKFPTSTLWVGAAERPEGPWELHSMGEIPMVEGPEHSKQRYCVYPHLWCSSPGKGQILISWSDNGTMGGKVFAGVFDFAIE